MVDTAEVRGASLVRKQDLQLLTPRMTERTGSDNSLVDGSFCGKPKAITGIHLHAVHDAAQSPRDSLTRAQIEQAFPGLMRHFYSCSPERVGRR